MQTSRLGLLLVASVFALLACSVAPTITARSLSPSPALCKSIVVLSPPAVYMAADPKRPMGGLDIQNLAQSLLTATSTLLNEAGNDTSTTLLSRLDSNLNQEVGLRHSSTGVSHALVVTAKRAVFASGMPRELEVEATLLDAKTMERVWEFTYQDKHAGGGAVPKAVDALISSLRSSGFVK